MRFKPGTDFGGRHQGTPDVAVLRGPVDAPSAKMLLAVSVAMADDAVALLARHVAPLLLGPRLQLGLIDTETAEQIAGLNHIVVAVIGRIAQSAKAQYSLDSQPCGRGFSMLGTLFIRLSGFAGLGRGDLVTGL